jgi:hypothetical protein
MAEGAIAARSEALVPWAQDTAAREVERLSREGKRVHEPPPEAQPQKDEGKLQALPQKAGRMLEAPPPQKSRRRKPEALPPEDKHELEAMPQRNSKRG